MLNKQDTSIVTLALLLSIATSPVAWAASRLNSNASVSASVTLSESLLQSQGRTNDFNFNQQPLNQPEQRSFKPKAVSKVDIAAGETRKTKVKQSDSLIAQLNFGKKNLVSQSTQTQPSTLAASSGEIPMWFWWLVPVVPVLGLWLRLKLKQQAQKPGTTLIKQNVQSDRNLSTLSPKPDHSQEKSQAAISNPILTEGTVLTPLTKPQFENEPFKLVQDNVEPEPEVILDQSLTFKSSLEEPFNPLISIPPNTVQESILVEEIPEPEAEAVIAEFLNAKKANLNQSNPVEPTHTTQVENVASELLISESSEKEEEEPLVVTEVPEPEVMIVEPSTLEEEESVVIAEITEPEVINSEVAIVEEEEPVVVAEVEESGVIVSEVAIVEEEESVVIAEITEPEVINSEVAIVEEEEPVVVAEVEESGVIVSEPAIVEEEESVVIAEITEPEVINSEVAIVEEEEPLVVVETTEPEVIISETTDPNPIAETSSEPELGIPHQDIKNEVDVVGMKFNIGGERKFEPALADVDEGLPNLADGYGQSKIILLPRDPNWAYAYWDVPNEHKERIRQQGGRYLLLRVYDVTAIDLDTQQPHWMQEYECDEMTKDWYIPVPMSDHDYIVELGYQAIDGRWLVLVRSNHVRVPPIYPTDQENYQFINISWDEDLRGKTFFRL